MKRVTNELHLRNYRIASYDMQHEPLEHADLYHVTMVIKTKRYLDESELFQFMQSLPDLTLERIAWLFSPESFCKQHHDGKDLQTSYQHLKSQE